MLSCKPIFLSLSRMLCSSWTSITFVTPSSTYFLISIESLSVRESISINGTQHFNEFCTQHINEFRVIFLMFLKDMFAFPSDFRGSWIVIHLLGQAITFHNVISQRVIDFWLSTEDKPCRIVSINAWFKALNKTLCTSSGESDIIESLPNEKIHSKFFLPLILLSHFEIMTYFFHRAASKQLHKNIDSENHSVGSNQGATKKGRLHILL